MHKIVNPIAEDEAIWLVNVWAQLIFNLEETQKEYKKECWWTLEGTSQF